jgi:hypothetical protein
MRSTRQSAMQSTRQSAMPSTQQSNAAKMQGAANEICEQQLAGITFRISTSPGFIGFLL